MLTITAISFSSCNNSSKSNETGMDSASSILQEDTTITRGDVDVFGETNPAETQVKSEGFGRCLESGCYCKAFKGRGQTCQNCGHAYKRHY